MFSFNNLPKCTAIKMVALCKKLHGPLISHPHKVTLHHLMGHTMLICFFCLWHVMFSHWFSDLPLSCWFLVFWTLFFWCNFLRVWFASYWTPLFFVFTVFIVHERYTIIKLLLSRDQLFREDSIVHLLYLFILLNVFLFQSSFYFWYVGDHLNW